LDDPVRAGHVLVGAREHGDCLHEISAEAAGDLLSLASDVARVICQKTNAQKVYVAAIGDKDKHFHVHLVPRYPDDPGLGPYVFGSSGWVGALKADPAAETADDISDAIKSL